MRTTSVIFISALCLQAQNRLPAEWRTSIQSGMADTFQLTLGGVFGEGPAFQNRITTGLFNAFRPGDSLCIYGWNSIDSPSRVVNSQAGIGYRTTVLKKGNQALNIGTGIQRWVFPGVMTGARDWLIPSNLTYQAKLRRIPFVLTSDSWTLLKSTLPTGSLLHTQAWFQHGLLTTEKVQIAFKHGLAHTYSWNFYGKNGNRIVRYQTALVISFKGLLVEGGYRHQWGLQPGMQNNNFWQFALTHTFTKPLSLQRRTS